MRATEVPPALASGMVRALARTVRDIGALHLSAGRPDEVTPDGNARRERPGKP